LPTFPVIPEAEMRRLLEPPQGPVRLVIDTDAHNEIDDQHALAWALLSQDVFKIEGVYAAPYSFQHHRERMLQAYEILRQDATAQLPPPLPHYRRSIALMMKQGIDPYSVRYVGPDEGMELSYQEILKIFDLLNEKPDGKVFRGSPNFLTSLDQPIHSPAAEHLIERAMAQEDGPLYVAAIGCLTNVASAILLEPEIISRIVVVWTSAYPSWVDLCNEPSLNLFEDKLASQLIFDCGVPHVYLPGYYIGAQLKVSLPEIERWVRGRGKIGDYIYHLYTHKPVHPMHGIDEAFGRTWVTWDIINFAWLLNPEWVPSHLVRAPILTDDLYWKHDPNRHWMREAVGIDRDAIFQDFFTRLEKAPKA
jgi:purine nucleosidase